MRRSSRCGPPCGRRGPPPAPPPPPRPPRPQARRPRPRGARPEGSGDAGDRRRQRRRRRRASGPAHRSSRRPRARPTTIAARPHSHMPVAAWARTGETLPLALTALSTLMVRGRHTARVPPTTAMRASSRIRSELASSAIGAVRIRPSSAARLCGRVAKPARKAATPRKPARSQNGSSRRDERIREGHIAITPSAPVALEYCIGVENRPLMKNLRERVGRCRVDECDRAEHAHPHRPDAEHGDQRARRPGQDREDPGHKQVEGELVGGTEGASLGAGPDDGEVVEPDEGGEREQGDAGGAARRQNPAAEADHRHPQREHHQRARIPGLRRVAPAGPDPDQPHHHDHRRGHERGAGPGGRRTASRGAPARRLRLVRSRRGPMGRAAGRCDRHG